MGNDHAAGEQTPDEVFLVLRQMLRPLGYEAPEDAPIGQMVGTVLGWLEAAIALRIDGSELGWLNQGYLASMLDMAKQDNGEATRFWLTCLEDRLLRTAVEMKRSGQGNPFSAVAVPAIMAAAEVTHTLHNDQGSTEELNNMIRDRVIKAEENLAVAQQALQALRQRLRADGIPV